MEVSDITYDPRPFVKSTIIVNPGLKSRLFEFVFLQVISKLQEIEYFWKFVLLPRFNKQVCLDGFR
jgi:hypothetical protein